MLVKNRSYTKGNQSLSFELEVQYECKDFAS